MDLYHVSLYIVERQMKQQFDTETEPERPQRAGRKPVRSTMSLRRGLGVALHALADHIEPTPATGQSHAS